MSEKIDRVEKRNLVASFFVTLLIGIAFQDMIGTVRSSLKENTFGWADVGLVVIFLLVAIRFFVGNQLHLLGHNFVNLPGVTWLYDLVMIITQTTVLIFLAGVTTRQSNVGMQLG